jgi:RNA polymerase sigma-70 factor (ECF subfamily)
VTRFRNPAAQAAQANVSSGEPRRDDLFALARAAATRDSAAAATLISLVGGTVVGTVRRVLGPGHPDIDDVAQEASIAFLGSLSMFRGECSTRRYAQRVALHTALTSRRRRALQEKRIDSEHPPEAVASELEGSPLSKALAARRRETLRKLLDSLPDAIAYALGAHFFFGYTVDEIAQTTSSPPNTIWSRLRLGKEALRKMLNEDNQLRELFELER